GVGGSLVGRLGAVMVWGPVVAAEILTLLMGAFFLVAGLFQLITPFVVSLPDWGWHALNGVITLLLGILILAQWPVSGLWVIGLFVGIELIFYGGPWIVLALSLRSLALSETQHRHRPSLCRANSALALHAFVRHSFDMTDSAKARAPILAAGGILLREGSRPRIAIVRLRRDKSWVLPKGKLYPGEHAVAAARREVMEETGHQVSVHEF